MRSGFDDIPDGSRGDAAAGRMGYMRGTIRAAMYTLALLLAVDDAVGAVSAHQATPVAAVDVVRTYSPGGVMTGFGPVEVPNDPQRVVTLAEYARDTAVSVGVTPVCAIAGTGRETVAPYIADAVPDVAIVGRAGAIDVDAVRALEPDLILASWQPDEALYAELSALAPTIVPPDIEEPGFDELRGWEYDVLVYAHALGKAKEAAVLLQEAHDRASSIWAADSSVVTGQRAVIVQWTGDGPVVLGPERCVRAQLYRDGFAAVEGAAGGPTSGAARSPPVGDGLFIAPVGDDGQAAYGAAAGKPDLDETRVVMVDGAVWASAAVPMA